MTTVKKIKACEVSFNTMTGISIRNIVIHDWTIPEMPVFTIGRERTKRQKKHLNDVVLFEGHLDEDKLNDMKYDTSEAFSKKRAFPAQVDDLKRDLAVWELIKNTKVLFGTCDIKAQIENAIIEGVKRWK